MFIQGLDKRAMIRNSRWPQCPYMVKTTQTISSPEPLGRIGKGQNNV